MSGKFILRQSTGSCFTRIRAAAIPAILAASFMAIAPSPSRAAGLSASAHEAVLAALDDEYHAEAVYRAVIGKFGNVRPFANIVRSEQQHQLLMKRILVAYGKPVPANPWMTGKRKLSPLPSTLGAACRIGIEAEKANATLYNRQLLPKVKSYPEITSAMKALRDASQYNHLPAFERCAARMR
ncbi:MAG: hypothetical protein H6888_01180 [Nitratireductor sp.]|nr:hypothetical protein [Nitratireductor sp.]MCC0019666.1 hypothetical protein [Nitratireductor sp.]